MKKILSIFLITLLIFTSLPVVYATDSGNASIEDMSSVSAENGLGKIIENLTEAENEDEYANSGYSISDMTFDDITANVTVNVPTECTLVVAIYDENTSELISSATKKLSASVYSEDYRKDIISLDMNMLVMPEHFLAKAFLLDENNNALCKNYTCRTYTTQFEIFMETTPADFEGKEIITMDDNCDDFGVLVDGAVAAEKSDIMTYTYDNGVYTFYNATDEVKNLKVDDIFYYQLSEEIGDFLLIKVLTIDVDGTTVSITEDDEIALGDAFQFIRVDEDADFSDIELTEENLGSALSVQSKEKQARLMSPRAEVDVSKETTFSSTLDVSFPNSKEENKEAWEKGWGIKGSIGYSLSASITLYYDVRSGDDFYEFSTKLTHDVSFNVSFVGKIESNPNYFRIKFPTIPVGVFNLDISVYPVLSAEFSMTFGGTIEIYNNVSFADGSGLTKTNETKWFGGEPTLGETEIEFKLGIGVDFDIGFKKGKKDVEGLSKLHASLSAGFEGGIKANFKPSLIGVLVDKHHNCAFCLEGSISAFLSGKATLKFKIIHENLKWSWDAISLTGTWTVGNCYFSMSNKGVKFGLGTCPYISHEVTITVYDQNGNPVKDAVVSTTTGYCDSDGDKKFKETSMKTDEDGQVVFYFAKGKHQVIAQKNNVGIIKDDFEIIAEPKEIVLILFNANEYNGHYYKVYDFGMSWSEANNYCKSLGGHLVTITSSSENSFVYSIIKNNKKTVYWLGGYLDGSWKWVTGEGFSYSRWGYYKPDNLTGEEIYLQMYRIVVNNNSASTWNDERPNGDPEIESSYSLTNTGFVCEWETIPSNTQVKSYRMTSRNEVEEPIEETIIDGTTASRNDALKGAEYVAVAVKNEFAEDLFANDNLIYIDQKTAESSTVSFDLVIPDGVENYAVKIFGVSHSHTSGEEVKENVVDSTCSKPGSYESVTYCTVCGEELSRDKVESPTLPHNYSTTVTAPSCTAQGYTTYICACGDSYVSDYVKALDHSYTAKTTAPTCIENGKTVYSCACGDTYTETIKATGHIFEDGESKCTNCDYDKAEGCSCNCHKNGIAKFFFNFILFFQKLFKANKICKCGINHY